MLKPFKILVIHFWYKLFQAINKKIIIRKSKTTNHSKVIPKSPKSSISTQKSSLGPAFIELHSPQKKRFVKKIQVVRTPGSTPGIYLKMLTTIPLVFTQQHKSTQVTMFEGGVIIQQTCLVEINLKYFSFRYCTYSALQSIGHIDSAFELPNRFQV